MSLVVPEGVRAAANRISIRRIVVLVLFGASAFVSGMMCQVHVDRQMPTIIIKPDYPAEPPAAPRLRTIT